MEYLRGSLGRKESSKKEKEGGEGLTPRCLEEKGSNQRKDKVNPERKDKGIASRVLEKRTGKERVKKREKQ